MTVKVVKKFKDKVTGEIRHTGEKITVSKERFKEIESVGHFIEEIKSKKEKASE